jgi:hypothetical protein
VRGGTVVMTDSPCLLPPALPQFGQQRRGQQTTVLYHGVSAMALKGLQDMGTNIGGSSSSFSQLPTQSVRTQRGGAATTRRVHVRVARFALRLGRSIVAHACMACVLCVPPARLSASGRGRAQRPFRRSVRIEER